MILMLNQMFLKCFYGKKQLKYFHDSLNIVLILVPGREYFLAKFVQFLLIFTD